MGQVFVLSRAASVAHAAPVLRALIEAVLGGVRRNDVVSARAAARALVALLDGLPAPATGNNVIKLAERREAYCQDGLDIERRAQPFRLPVSERRGCVGMLRQVEFEASAAYFDADRERAPG